MTSFTSAVLRHGLLLAALVAFALVAGGPCVAAGAGDCRITVSLSLPGDFPPGEQAPAAVEALMTEAKALGAHGALLTMQGSSDQGFAAARHAGDWAARNEFELWLGVPFPASAAPQRVDALAPLPCHGLALVLAPPQGEPLARNELVALLERQAAGRKLGDAVRRLRRKLDPGKKLALCVALSEIRPETTRSLFVPVPDLVRDGTLDLVWAANAEGHNFHRLRLLRDKPLEAGLFVDVRAAAEKKRAGLVERLALAALGNKTCQRLLVHGVSAGDAMRVIADARQRRERAEARRLALAADIAAGKFALDQEAPVERCNDQATVHGVAQSFTPSRTGACPLIQVYASIRHCSGPAPPPLEVQIRPDQDGRPGEQVHARTEIAANEFAHAPTYRWGSAGFQAPPRLEKGRTYWLHLPDAQHQEGVYVWRMIRNGATERGRAWSSLYEYGKHTWVFRIYLASE